MNDYSVNVKRAVQRKVKKTEGPGFVSFEEEISGDNADLVNELDSVKREMQDYKDIAISKSLAEFEKEKLHYASLIRQSVGDEKAQQFLERVGDDPGRLEAVKALMPIAGQMFEAGYEKEMSAANPPGGSQVSLRGPRVGRPNEYENYAAMVDDLRERANAGDEKAIRDYREMWQKGVEKLRQMMEQGKNIGIIMECPWCHRGIAKNMLKDGKLCPFCEEDIEEFRRQGGEIF